MRTNNAGTQNAGIQYAGPMVAAIDSGGNPKHKSAEDKIGRENIHDPDSCSHSAVKNA